MSSMARARERVRKVFSIQEDRKKQFMALEKLVKGSSSYNILLPSQSTARVPQRGVDSGAVSVESAGGHSSVLPALSRPPLSHCLVQRQRTERGSQNSRGPAAPGEGEAANGSVGVCVT